jgi:phenylacetate-CoA ligase
MRVIIRFFWSSRIPAVVNASNAMDVYRELPIISSEDIAGDLKPFVSKYFNRRNSYSATTGGTGRRPTPLILSNASYGTEWRHIHYIWSIIGYQRRKHLKLTITGRRLPGDKYLYYNPLYNEIVVDFFRVTVKNFPEFLAQLSKYPIDYLETYPSLLRELRGYLEHFGLSIKIKGIMLGSEGIDQRERRAAEIFFRCPIIAWYGQSERVILAVDHDNSGTYRAFSSYGYPDVIDEGCGFGEIVGTSFVNRALPLIKYRTGDYGSIIQEDCVIRITDISGRWGKDFLYLDTEKRIPSTAVNLHSDIQKEILFFQMIQSRYGQVRVLVLPNRSSRLSREKISSIIASELSAKLVGFSVECIVVDSEKEIRRSERGKMMMLVQELDHNLSQRNL